MFSEYASRFLAQSQSRLSLSQAGDPSSNRAPLDRQRGNSSRVPSRGYLQRQPFSSPYQHNSQTSRFPFASRLSTQPAPLFYSATDDFREEDDGEEHEREVADFFALQRSRRDFGTGRITDSSGSEGPDGDMEDRQRAARLDRGGVRSSRFAQPRGIRSSWNGDADGEEEVEPAENSKKKKDIKESSIAGSTLGKTRDHLVDVNLASTIHEADEEDFTGSFGASREFSMEIEDAPSVQQFRTPPSGRKNLSKSRMYSQETSRSMALANPPPRSSSDETAPAPLTTGMDPPRHDVFWSTLYITCLASVFATFLLVCLHTSKPDDRMGDTVYTALSSSYYLLAVDTLIAVIVALLWLAALRSFVRALVYLILVGVPIISLSFGLYPFISSFKSSWSGASIQDRAMRWTSLIPILFSVGWVFTAWSARHSLHRAIELLEFSVRILSTSPPLVAVGFGALASLVTWTWVWLLMFTRVFLGGHFSKASHLFVINTGTWWLGAFFVLTYLWTLGVVSGIQRATTAATVSQWYFHRLATPAPSSSRVVSASLVHATSTIFGTICFSTLLSLAVRLPLLLLPRRVGVYISMLFYSFVPTSIAVLTNPLTLTYAAIHSQGLTNSARGLAEMSFISYTSPTNMLTPGLATGGGGGNHFHGGGGGGGGWSAGVRDGAWMRGFTGTFTQGGGGGGASNDNRGGGSGRSNRLYAYRLAKLILHAVRLVTALAFGVGGWVSTARSLQLASTNGGVSYRGSLYAYVVGFVAGAIGWTILGAMEGILGGILDAVVVCWGSETKHLDSFGVGVGGGGSTANNNTTAAAAAAAAVPNGARYCREADELLRDDGDNNGMGADMGGHFSNNV